MYIYILSVYKELGIIEDIFRLFYKISLVLTHIYIKHMYVIIHDWNEKTTVPIYTWYLKYIHLIQKNLFEMQVKSQSNKNGLINYFSNNLGEMKFSKNFGSIIYQQDNICILLRWKKLFPPNRWIQGQGVCIEQA